jgi:glutathione peroxidase
LYDFTARTIDGEIQDLDRYRGQVVLVVNTASACGFTSQLAGLEALQLRYGPRGFSVLGFPSHQFRQELDTDQEIKNFCEDNYRVSFPLFSVVDVNGPDAHPLFSWLQTQKGGVIGGRISWNFTKFLVGRDGQLLRRYAPPVPPSRIAHLIERELA